MPTLDDLLSQTMLFTGAKGSNQQPVPMELGGRYRSPKPNPTKMADTRPDERRVAAIHNEIWQFSWDGRSPGTFEDVEICTRGMDMDYSMMAKVFEKVEVLGVTVERKNGDEIALLCDQGFAMAAWRTQVGTIADSETGLWRLRAKLDSSMLVLFGYELGDAGMQPLSLDDARSYGDELMPSEGWLGRAKWTAGDPGERFVCVGPCRYIVAVELVLCKERPDFVPGDMVGFARIHPHVLVWSNEELVRVETSITLKRPARGMACAEDMKERIGSLLVADTNVEHAPNAEINIPIPYTDNLYDYYVTNPYHRFKNRKPVLGKTEPLDNDHPRQQLGEVTLADARHEDKRTNYDAVTRSTLFVPNNPDVRKCPRQGQFDNVHIAARMRMEFEASDGKLGTEDPKVVLDDIVMINQCVHDCVHMHVRWSEFLESKMLAGWGPAGPFTKPGAPAVPLNQSVFLSFESAHEVVYRAVAEPCRPGELQVFCHHGMAYAVDVWPTAWAFAATQGLIARIAAQALVNDEPYRGQMPFPPGWAEFYWRVRYTGTFGGPHVERLTWPDLERCMR